MLCYSSSRNWSEPTHSPSLDPKQGPQSQGPPGKVLGFISGATTTNTNFNSTLTLSQERNFSHSTFSTNWYEVKCILEDPFSIAGMSHGQRGGIRSSTPFWPVTLKALPTQRPSTAFQNSLCNAHSKGPCASGLPVLWVTDPVWDWYRNQNVFSPKIRIEQHGYRACVLKRNCSFLIRSLSFPHFVHSYQPNQ